MFRDFFIQNWRLILEALLVLVSFIFMIVRKRPTKVIDTIQTLIVRLLPGLINQAEIDFGSGNGSAKKNFVLDHLHELLLEFGYSDEVVSQYKTFASDQVEVILSTPKKKGM